MPFQPIENLKKTPKPEGESMSTDKDYYFEILAIDNTGKVFIKNEDGFCHNLVSNNDLWTKPEIKSDNFIFDNNKRIRLHVRKNTSQADLAGTNPKQVFVITVNGKFADLESFRLPLLKYLRTLNFDSLYVLEDHISLNIARAIYPGIYKVESFLRKYVIKFFAIKLGPEWWNLTADSEMQKKTIQRKNNETIFSEFVDNKVYLIDFGELGKLIYSQSSGNLSKDDIINKVVNLEDTTDALKNLKKKFKLTTINFSRILLRKIIFSPTGKN